MVSGKILASAYDGLGYLQPSPSSSRGDEFPRRLCDPLPPVILFFHVSPQATCGNILEIVFTIAAPAFDILFIGSGCVLNTKIAYTNAEKLTFEAFY